MNAWIKEHPLWFLLFVMLYCVGSMIHLTGAGEYCKKHERSFFEGLSLIVVLLVAWPIFSFGMMCRGYASFYRTSIKAADRG
jgi:hypothetical protein